MTERRATTSYFLPIGTAALITFAALVIATVRSRDTVDAFVATGASLVSPDFQASAPISLITASICARTISTGTSCTALTPSVFCTVIAVMAVAA